MVFVETLASRLGRGNAGISAVSVITYEDIEALDPSVPTVFVDMAGNAALTTRVHHHFGDALRYSCLIGATHWEHTGPTQDLPGAKPSFFFAPSQLAKRGKEWGRTVLNERMDSALADFVTHSHQWLHIEHGHGADTVAGVYNELVSGRVRPEAGHILTY